MLIALLSSVLAAPAGYSHIKDNDGCSFYKSPNHESGYPTIRAECSWSDVSAEQLDGVVSQLDRHDEIHSSVAQATIVGPQDGGTLVRQVHVAAGISDRQADMVYKRAVLGETIVHSWSMAANQPAPEDGRVVPDRDDGKWEITPNGSGVTVVYELRYEPGGSVPGFVVRAFQSSGIVTIVGEMHAAAK